ncbi:import inner membrane translocase subunit TIM9 domain protein [Necator americanus]|uniref:Mitochondrial import inner membrane translocase subunit n=1 Tax=Necator americanus TaxID=51031 RepID=W2TTW9_NECAM|nr:import inner membrane translocase subunit TIM9 domain protein [Necator americanus]ETN84546.1 import inner membrane translocase subunit TIM9 domain protein [Necator americanus]
MAAQAGTTAATTDTDLKTFRDFLMQYNNVTEQCFGACINDMTTRTVSEKEEKCSMNCLDKYLKMTQRVSLRFQEHQLLSAEVQGANLSRS